MAVRNAVAQDFVDSRIITWSGLLNGDSGDQQGFLASGDKSVQFNGTFGVGGTIVFEGSNDGLNWFVLTDLQTVAISKTAAALEGIAEATLYVRPRVTAGDGTTSIIATMVVRQK